MNGAVKSRDRAAIGIDIGGTKVAGVVVDSRGRLVDALRRTHDGSGAGALGVAAQLAGDLATAHRGAVGIGFAVAGLVDRERDELVHGALLGLRGERLGDLVGERANLPVVVENDANATLAGVLATLRPVVTDVRVLVALGTGVGGAISVGDAIVTGSGGFGGELGHIPVTGDEGPACPCGGRGCLELFASGTAVARIAAERAGRAYPGPELVEAANRRDALARNLLHETGDAIGRGLLGIISALDPSTVYLSGGFGHAAARHLIPAIRDRLGSSMSFRDSRSLPLIQTDPVGPGAAAYGAAVIALRRAPQSSHHSRERRHA